MFWPRRRAAPAAASGAAPAAASEVDDTEEKEQAIWVWDLGKGTAQLAAGLSYQIGPATRGCAVGENHVAFITRDYMLRCAGNNEHQQLGCGPGDPPHGLAYTFLPWQPGIVSAGQHFSLLMRTGGGHVHTWGIEDGRLGRGLACDGYPAPVEGLPVLDEAVLASCGTDFVILITRGDSAWGWGMNEHSQLCLPLSLYYEPTCILGLCRKKVVRLSCGGSFALGESANGVLLWWGTLQRGPVVAKEPTPISCPDLAFPLRGLASGVGRAIVADSRGAVWCLGSAEPVLTRVALRVPAVRVAAAWGKFVALTEDGQLWDCSDADHIGRNVRSTFPQLPLGLVPYGGPCARRFLLIDSSYDKKRCRSYATQRVFLLVVARRARQQRPLLPQDPAMIRSALLPHFNCWRIHFEELPTGGPRVITTEEKALSTLRQRRLEYSEGGDDPEVMALEAIFWTMSVVLALAIVWSFAEWMGWVQPFHSPVAGVQDSE